MWALSLVRVGWGGDVEGTGWSLEVLHGPL